jgi:DNA-binding transcriptional regulator YdaS (Cro superfamily)
MENPLVVYRREHEVSQRELAKQFGVLAPAICKWEQRRVPADRVLDVERVTGISRHVLRPDIFGASGQVQKSLGRAKTPPKKESDPWERRS